MHASVDIPDGEKPDMTRAILEIFRVMIPGTCGCRKNSSYLICRFIVSRSLKCARNDKSISMPKSFPTIEALKPLIGQEIGVSDWLTITQPMIDAFAAVTGDRQWIHCDPERAEEESPYDATIAHGFLTLSLLSQLHAQAVHIEGGFHRIINYGLNRVRFPSPVTVGSRIRVRSMLQHFGEIAHGHQLTWHLTVEREGHSKPALVAEWVLRYYR
jgi:acyl dehydratase